MALGLVLLLWGIRLLVVPGKVASPGIVAVVDVVAEESPVAA